MAWSPLVCSADYEEDNDAGTVSREASEPIAADEQPAPAEQGASDPEPRPRSATPPSHTDVQGTPQASPPRSSHGTPSRDGGGAAAAADAADASPGSKDAGKARRPIEFPADLVPPEPSGESGRGSGKSDDVSLSKRALSVRAHVEYAADCKGAGGRRRAGAPSWSQRPQPAASVVRAFARRRLPSAGGCGRTRRGAAREGVASACPSTAPRPWSKCTLVGAKLRALLRLRTRRTCCGLRCDASWGAALPIGGCPAASPLMLVARDAAVAVMLRDVCLQVSVAAGLRQALACRPAAQPPTHEPLHTKRAERQALR